MADFTRHERGFVGNLDDLSLPNMHTGDPVAFSGPNLDRYFSWVPFVDGDSWGSAHDDDPAPERSGGSILQGMGTDKSSPYSQQMLGASGNRARSGQEELLVPSAAVISWMASASAELTLCPSSLCAAATLLARARTKRR